MEDDVQSIKARVEGGHQRKKAFYINRIETQKKSQNPKQQAQFLHVCFPVGIIYLKVEVNTGSIPNPEVISNL